MPKCKIKVNNLYLSDFWINADGTVTYIEFNNGLYYVFNSGAEAEQTASIFEKELAIPKEKIKIFMVE